MVSVEEIKDILCSIKIDQQRYESCVVSEIERVLTEHEVRYSKEISVSKGCRVDILTEDGVVIEVKKGRPNQKAVLSQLERYSGSEKSKAVILVSERGLFSNVKEMNGKPIKYVSLCSNWGMTV